MATGRTAVRDQGKRQLNLRLSEGEREALRLIMYLATAPSVSALLSAALTEFGFALVREMAREESAATHSNPEAVSLLLKALSEKDGMTYRYNEEFNRIEYEESGEWHPVHDLTVRWH